MPPENVVDEIVTELRASVPELYPDRGELRNVRVVGHTPKTDHFIYDVVIDFLDDTQRVAAKVYRSGKSGADPAKKQAAAEYKNVAHVYALASKKRLGGVPRPLGDYSPYCAVVTEKIVGVPLQSIIMKAALLPGYGEHGTLELAAGKTGAWLRSFHKISADMHEPFDSARLLSELEKQSEACRKDGLEDNEIRVILSGAKQALAKVRKSLPSSAVLCDFTPLNVVVGDSGIGVCDYAKLKTRGLPFLDVAQFLACVESLEKYPFCNRAITTNVQAAFCDAYGLSESEMGLVRVLRMKALLSMFAQGRNTGKETAMRKKVMWANVMKRFIGQAARRSLQAA